QSTTAFSRVSTQAEGCPEPAKSPGREDRSAEVLEHFACDWITHLDIVDVGNNAASSYEPTIAVVKQVLRSASNKNNAACIGPLNDSATAQPALRKGKSGSSSGSTNNSVRVLRSASKNKDDVCSESLNDSIAGEPTANKRTGIGPSKVASPIKSVRVLSSASKNKDGACSESLNDIIAGEPATNKRTVIRPSKAASPINSVRVLRSATKNEGEAPLNGITAGEKAANERKCVTPSKAGRPNNSVRVLRSASKNKNDACSDSINDGTVAQPSAKKRKTGSPLKSGSPPSSARVLRSNSKGKNETFNEPVNDSTAAQPATRKRKIGTPPNEGSQKLGVRVLRSASKKENDSCFEPKNVSTSDQPAVRKRKTGRSSQERSPKKAYLKVCQRVRSILNRMNYEQSLIQAYASEGWKGQSLEKIRPEKELERAKAEILRCKIKIREAFQSMDSLLSEGKLEESLFDSAGEIFSEDIFCAICGSKDVTLQNDIVLCDGACDRGFHQNCLNPPLLTEDIPQGDEGWFCPACVCKIDCIDALNELQGTKLSIHDSWEKVFPEAASLANGSKQLDASDPPLGDSENNDYNPALAEAHMGNEVRSDAGNDGKGTVDDLGLPSEDSEDDDFDPAGPDSSEDQKTESHSEESDFTSDSDDFCDEIAKSSGQVEVSVSPLSNVNEESCNDAFTEMELEQDVVLPVSGRRQVERLDYKKLYDEAYGESSSSSSDDEEWSGNEKLEDSETDGSVCAGKRCSRRASAGHPVNQHAPLSERHDGSVSEHKTEVLHSNGSNSTSRRFGPIIKQKLKNHFERDPYPNRATKENLAQELGLTFIQVDKWFASTRHSSRVAAAKMGKCRGSHTTEYNDGMTVDSAQVREPNDEVSIKLTADRNGLVYEREMMQNNLDEGNKEDKLLSRAETETEADGKESSDQSDDKEWSGTSISQKELEDSETDSLAASNRATRLSRGAPVGQQNNEHTPISERLHGSVDEQQTEAPCSSGSSGKAQKYHFGPVVTQKLKVHFEKDPYPSRSTVQSLAQELGLTFIQVRRWFSSTRHYSSVSAAKKGKDPGNQTTEKNDSTTVDSLQVKESNNRMMENPTSDRNDMVSQKLMLQINLNEGNTGDIILNQYPSCEETVVTTPTAISREVGPPGYRPGENQGNGTLWNTGFEQGLITTPSTVSIEVGPPGYGPGENQGYGASWNTISEQRIPMTPITATMPISQEIGPPGSGPGENHVSGASWNTSFEERLIMTPNTGSREAGPPRYGPGEGQVNVASWNTSTEQRVGTAPSTISRQVSPPGYGPGENQVSAASWNTSTEQRVVTTPYTIPREVGPPGYWPGEIQGNSAWNHSCEKSVFMTPTTTTSKVSPLGYRPRENQGNGASNVESPKGMPSQKLELDDEARKKAIARELRRMKKFR
ncbi:hypothetical protein EJB05_16990, partial [Eragrostis curvula]